MLKRKFGIGEVLAVAAAVGLLVAATMHGKGPVATAQAGQGGCELLRYQSAAQAQSEIGARFAAGATVVSFSIESSQMPYTAFVCQR